MNREHLLDKIRALLSKTTENGCTEFEALASLDKARAMMDAYEVTESDLQLTKEEKAILRSEPEGSKDPHGCKRNIAMAVAQFTDCKVWKGPNGLVFCGLPSDARFASWLVDHLASFIQSELASHLMGSLAPRGERRLLINGFVLGCASRISARIKALCAQSATVATSNGTALVVIKGQAVAEKMKELRIHLRSSRTSRKSINGDSYRAGQSAGDRASFGRPIAGNAGTLRIGS
jgi:hypothetical protein